MYNPALDLLALAILGPDPDLVDAQRHRPILHECLFRQHCSALVLDAPSQHKQPDEVPEKTERMLLQEAPGEQKGSTEV